MDSKKFKALLTAIDKGSLTSAAAELGCSVSAFDIMPNLFYPYLLAVSALTAIFLVREKR